MADPLRGPNLFGHGRTQIVDEVERRLAVNDDVARERQRPAVGDQRLEALDEEDDVQGSAPLR
jgi:hypothetical protein